MITKKQIPLIYKLAADRGVDNETLHEIIFTYWKTDSVKALSAKDASELIELLSPTTEKPETGERMITTSQRKYIKDLAVSIGFKTDKGRFCEQKMNAYLLNRYGIENLNWLTVSAASKVIEGLKAQIARAV